MVEQAEEAVAEEEDVVAEDVATEAGALLALAVAALAVEAADQFEAPLGPLGRLCDGLQQNPPEEKSKTRCKRC